MSKGRIFSGMRPTGKLHIGHLSVIENWVRLQEEYQCFFAPVDWHALTTGYEDTAGIKEDTREMVIDWLSAGLDPEKVLSLFSLTSRNTRSCICFCP